MTGHGGRGPEDTQPQRRVAKVQIIGVRHGQSAHQLR
jgi:hypothetical protein